MKDSKLIVIALGGNAIIESEDLVDIPSQFARTAKTAVPLADLMQAGHRLVLTHGNGPQIGNALRRIEMVAKQVYPLPLEVLVADTQGGIGYMIAQCLTNELVRRGLISTVLTVVTTVVVDSNDPDFVNPTKPIGPFYTKRKAALLQETDGWDMREVLRGKYRRVVPSPRPRCILEIEAIKRLVDSGQLLIACGGGGVPVIKNAQEEYEGVAAVVDKDLASAILATGVDADCFVILTTVRKVCINFEKSDQTQLDNLTVEQAQQYLAEGQFPPGSMGPKIEAAIQFLQNSDKPEAEVLITDAENVLAGLAGQAGTRITQN